jgi:hypothetical protein
MPVVSKGWESDHLEPFLFCRARARLATYIAGAFLVKSGHSRRDFEPCQ